MSDGGKPEPRLLLTLLAALWLMAFVYAFVAARATAATAMGLSAAVEVLGTFLGWQGVAALFALACFGVSRAWPRGAAARRLGAVPLLIAGLVVLAFALVIGGSILFA